MVYLAYVWDQSENKDQAGRKELHSRDKTNGYPRLSTSIPEHSDSASLNSVHLIRSYIPSNPSILGKKTQNERRRLYPHIKYDQNILQSKMPGSEGSILFRPCATYRNEMTSLPR